MRIAVDATSLLDVRTGVGNFTDAVVRGLAGRADVTTTVFPVSLRGHRRLRAQAPPGVRVVTPPLPARLLRKAWLATGRPSLDPFIGRHDVVYGPNFVVPPSRSVRVVTVHDLTSVRFPELCTDDTRQYPSLLRRAIADGAWIHTVSAAVRDEVLDEFDVRPERVVAVPNGFRPIPDVDPARGTALAGRADFALAVGTVEPRKDLPTLVRAVDLAADEGLEIPLVHVGPPGWGTDELDAAIADMRRPDLVVRLGSLAQPELDALYRSARLLAYPSRYEGFGLPVLEAMSAGTPVVATDDPAIAEVAGGAAHLVTSNDPAALAAGIRRVWTDDGHRETMIEAGTRRAGEYSWDRCVDGLVELFSAAVADRRSR